MSKNQDIQIYDTTLRDGTQGEGVSFRFVQSYESPKNSISSGSITSRVVGLALILEIWLTSKPLKIWS